MSARTFKVTKVESYEWGFKVKLSHKSESVSTIQGLGTVESKQSETYYIKLKALDKPAAEMLGMEYSLDPSLFDIVEKPFALPGTGEIVMLKHLYPKRS